MFRSRKEMFDLKTVQEKKRSRFRLGVLAALLVVAAVLAFCAGAQQPVPETGDLPAPTAPAPTAPPQNLTARQQREVAYQKDLSKLEALLQQENINEETKQQAALQMTRMVGWHQTELALEEALVSAGFAPCLVLMQNDALTVAVSASEVTAAQSAVILSICLAHTEVAAENIRIMPGGV